MRKLSNIVKNSCSMGKKLAFQIKLLIWKRYVESTKNKWDLIKVILPAVLMFVLMILLYSVFDFLAAGAIEPFLVPLAFWIFTQRLVVQIMFEKSSRLQESMRMMGLRDIAYWISYIISDGVILGFSLSFLCTIFTVGGLFNNANFGVILGLLFIFCLSTVPFAFFICSFFDTPQTSGQATLGLLLGLFVVYIVVFSVETMTISYHTTQVICCLFPPLALQIGAGAFLKSYDGIDIASICGMMVADIFIYAILAWYFSQVWFTKIGVSKPWYFPLKPSYWCPKAHQLQLPHAKGDEIEREVKEDDLEDMEEGSNTAAVGGGGVGVRLSQQIPMEIVDETLLGRPTVIVQKLCKTFGVQKVLDDLSFSMYEDQIFALLGHNGAGKTTAINMLTGLLRPDLKTGDHGASIYGSDILTEMDQVRMSMGICPQHDVLFEGLSVREHILFFAQLKGASYEDAQAEATNLTTMFHLEERMDHLGNELSGGQRRKLSVAIAVCGGSKFVVLDEPTAGMDPLARRELWNLLASLRKGRTMLLTTHYMDEADVLGDRVGIMSLGQMQCVGTTQFLKNTYGAGYKLICVKKEGMTADQLAQLTDFVHRYIPEAKYLQEDGTEDQALYNLPFNTIAKFGPFFTELEKSFDTLHVSNFGVTITSLEDVFLKVGEDQAIKHTDSENVYGIGKDRTYHSNMTSQIIGICRRKLTYCYNDFTTIPLLVLPIAVGVAAAVLYKLQVLFTDNFFNNLVIAGLYVGGYLGAPGLLAEFIVRERNDKLRNVLTVMGCDFRAYWIGTFLADFLIMMIPMVAIWITWGAADMSDFYAGMNGLNFFIFLLFNTQLIAFSYFFSFIFTSPKSCISLMPIMVLLLVITPNIILLIMINIAIAAGDNISQSVQGGILLWGIMILTPHGAFFSALLNTTLNYSSFISSFPPIGAVIAFQIVETGLFLFYAYYRDAKSVEVLQPQEDPSFDSVVLENLDEDVLAERVRTLEDPTSSTTAPLRLERLRLVFPPKTPHQKPVVATQDIALTVEKGEIFGLLGSNGAGKTTTLSMLTRHFVPTSGNAFITGYSILSEFSKAATHMGVVTQNNSLWDRLSVEDHLYLFARLRGVPEDLVDKVVDGTIDQLELTPHRHKLSMRLSGGMKRKLCVAIALIGDPEVVLLDEPSAGLDPVSRRNLWSVILRTMSHRAVILTTHSMDEAEALCKRIGIMVHGQLRALGTKQHLKNKFGSGFELVVKLALTANNDYNHQKELLSSFVANMFASAAIISEHSGLITYEIPRGEMRMGLAFTQLERHKVDLSIEDYSVSQPTLEQVFIRTVNKYSNISTGSSTSADRNAGSVTQIGGSARMSVEGTGLISKASSNANLQENNIHKDGVQTDSEQENQCGCSNSNICVVITVLSLLLVVCIGIAIGVAYTSRLAAGIIWIFALICLVSLIVSCCLRYSMMCRVVAVDTQQQQTGGQQVGG